MKVTKDEFQLPLVIADSSVELAEMCGTTANNITSIALRGRTGEIKNPSYVKVKVERD
jgi:hypothetical protein